MSRILVYRLFGFGKVPKTHAAQILRESSLMRDEGPSGTVAFGNFRAPGQALRLAAQRHGGLRMNDSDPTRPQVLAFDIFGTVVDWHASIAREVAALGLDVDAADFARAWRAGYKPAMARVASGELGWTLIDDLHRMILDETLEAFGVASLDEPARQHLNKAWHRPRRVAGCGRGAELCCAPATPCARCRTATSACLRTWPSAPNCRGDCILSAEVFRKYKPDPDTYLGVARVFDVAPEKVMMVAAHQDDLAAARACGLQTAYVERPLEFGEGPAQGCLR